VDDVDGVDDDGVDDETNRSMIAATWVA
jgi:hypothetical protein